MYLIHSVIGYTLIQAFADDGNFWLVCSTILVLVIVGSQLIHALVERRMSPMWSRFFAKFVGRPIDVLNRSLDRILRRLLVRRADRQPDRQTVR